MGKTLVGVGNAKAVKRWSSRLSVDQARTSFWTSNLAGKGEETTKPQMVLEDLENQAGDEISYDLSIQLKMQPIEGDDPLKGREEKLTFYTDTMKINQLRQGINAGGRMTQKRTLHSLRKVGKRRTSEYWGRVYDELSFMYASGTRGGNTDYVFASDYTGHAGNAFTAPDTEHLLVAGGLATLETTNKMTVSIIDQALSMADMMGGGTQETPKIQPTQIEGGKYFCQVMNGWSAYNLRQDTGTNGWLTIEKAVASAVGYKANIFKQALGMHNGVVLKKAQGTVRLATTAYANVAASGYTPAERSLFLGAQGTCVSWGSPGGDGMRFNWHEETDDRGNVLIIDTDCKLGIKKNTYNGKDFGIIAVDVASEAA